MGEKQTKPFQLSFNGLLKVDFQGSHVTSDGGLILVRELDERLGLGELIDEHLSDSRQGRTAPFSGVTETVVLETPVLIGYARISKADGSQSLDCRWMLCARPASGTTRSTRTKRPDSVRTARGSPPSSRRRDRET